MNKLENPYASPAAPQYLPGPIDVQLAVVPASQGARFLNSIIDYFGYLASCFAAGIVIAIIGGEQAATFIEGIPELVLSLSIFLAYYFVLEAATGRTLGKLITGTKVVDQHGNTPTLGQIAGRTLCRLIPFEAFSFFGTPTRGWHDSIPKTFVVKTR